MTCNATRVAESLDWSIFHDLQEKHVLLEETLAMTIAAIDK